MSHKYKQEQIIKYILEYNSFYFVIPIYLATLIVFFVFNVPPDFYGGVLFLPIILSFITITDLLKKPSKSLEIASNWVHDQNRTYTFIAVSFSCGILIFCFIDLAVNGLKILEPAKYAELPGYGKYVRNISNMCWVFIPIAFYCIKNKIVKVLFYLSAILFPILFIDRNRLMMALFCLLWLYIINAKKGAVSFWKALIFICFIVVLFVSIGNFRSGAGAFDVPSSGFELIEQKYPLKNWFSSLPSGTQQVLIYISSPIFNFATVENKEFINPVFLQQQLSPFNRTILYPDSPVLVPKFNVGTEFFPFLMMGGKKLVFVALLFMFSTFIVLKAIYSMWPNIFTLLIFMRVSYVVLLMGFAPQFYILTNVAFFFLCFFLWLSSDLLHSAVTKEIEMPFKFKFFQN